MFKSTTDIIKKFVQTDEDKKTDFLKRENSNFIYCLSLLRKNISNYSEERYLFKEIFSPKLVKKYKEGEIYIHDKSLAPYCNSTSCRDVAMKGIPTNAKNMIESKPTKDFFYFTRHLSNVVTLISQQVSGAVMLAGATSVLASYLFHEEIYQEIYRTDKEVYKYLRSLIWELNMPLRAGSESPFSNITLEFGRPSGELKNQHIVVGGDPIKEKYGDIPDEYFDRINKTILDIMSKGAGKGRAFTFPLLTVPIDDDFDWNNKIFDYSLEKLYDWGGMYFENFQSKPFENDYYRTLNPKIKPRDPDISRSLCCRLQIDLSLLSQSGGGVFGSSTSNVGAVQVLNLNLNRIALKYKKTSDKFLEAIKEDLELMQEGHQAKRKWLENHKELYPTFFSYNENLKNYFNVFAVTGMHEAMMTMGFENGMKDTSAKIEAHRIMQFISEIVESFIKRDNVACGIEYAPAENAAIKMARDDIKFADTMLLKTHFQGTVENPFLTAGCMLPFSEENMIEVIENHAEFQAYATSGSIFHNFLETKLEPEQLKKYIKRIFSKPINYITVTPTRTVCNDCGHAVIGDIPGENCPNCESDDLSVWSRVIGYYKPVARKSLHISNGSYEGTYNFWSAAKRIDWASRAKLTLEKFKDFFAA